MSHLSMLRKLLFIVLFCFAALCTFAQSTPATKGISKPKKPSDNTLPADPSKGDFRNLSVADVVGPASVTASPGTICSGSSVSLSASCESGTVIWYDEATGGVSLGTGSPLVQNPTVSTTYYAACDFTMGPTRVTVNESERVATSMVTVVHLSNPTGVSVNKTSILSGAPVVLSAACSVGNVVWYNQETGGSEIGVGTSVTYYPGVNTTFYANCRSGSCESSRANTTQVSVTSMPPVPYMVSDNIVPGAGSSDKDEFVNLNGTLFFITETPDYGRELWKSDGTIEGTVIVKDINPGTETSYVSSLTKVGNLLFFFASDGEHGSELWISDGSADGTMMVKDITVGISNTEISSITDVNGTAFFTVNDEFLGLELWKSDGTENGTMLVKDILDGIGSSEPQNLTNVNGTLFFTASDETNGVELWKSDGTALGTVMVKDIRTGTNQSSIPQKLTNVNGIVYFIANDGTNGNELWRSDGTTDSTYMVKDITIGAEGIEISYMTSIDDIVYMVANTSQYGEELWRSDGTSNGTYLVKDINSGSNGSGIQKLVIKDKNLYFGANNGINGYELWKSNGTLNGTGMVIDIIQGSGSSFNSGPVNSDGTIYFIADNGEGSSVLWQTDGPYQSTEMVNISNFTFSVEGLGSLIDVNGKLFFKAALTAGAVNYGNELWSLGTCTDANKIVITDGKADYLNYQSLDDAICHCDVFNRIISKLAGLSSEVASSLITAREWSDEEAPQGFAGRHYEISTNNSQHLDFAEGKVTLYFTQADFDNYNLTVPEGGIKLPANSSDKAGKDYLNIVRYAQTNEETGLPGDFGQGAETLNPKNADIIWNDTLERWEVSFATPGLGQFFVKAALSFTEPDDVIVSSTSICEGQDVSLSASCGGMGTPIWYNTDEPGWENPIGTGSPFVVNPTENITYYVTCKINDGDTQTGKIATEPITITTPVPQELSVDKTSIISGAKVKLSATCSSGEVVWYNQASGGSDIGVGTSNVYFPTKNTTFYAACRTAICETRRLATEAVNVTDMRLLPYKVKEINPNTPSNPDYFTSVNGTAFFIANSAGYGRELWKSDGTQEGTVMVKDIVQGAQNPSISQLKKSGGLLFFKTAIGVNAQQLWVSNGESSGTTMLIGKTKVDNITDVNGTVFFTASDSEHGSELWKSNGTAEGTVIVKDIWEGNQGSAPAKLTNVNGTLFFSANTSEYGRELWKSDGTPEGTVLVKDLISGSESLTPDSLRNINGVLYFINTTDINGSGVGLWRSDGTADGTYSVKRLNSVNYIVGLNNEIYFTGDDVAHGSELWRSSGVPEDATLIIDINEAGSSSPQNIVVMDGILYFKANDGILGNELWKSTGSADRTSLVKDIYPGSAGALGNELINIDGTLYFFADNGTYEYGLWKSNGTEEGTVLIRGVETDQNNFPTRLSNINGKLYFNGDMFNTGDYYDKELWSLGTCTDANKMIFASGKTNYYNVQQQLINETTSCHCDIYNNLISKIDAIGENPMSGSVEVREWIDNTAATTHVKRHYEIYNTEDAVSSSIGTGNITLYFTQAEFDAYNNAVSEGTPKLPANGEDTAGKANIVVNRYSGTSGDETGLPGTYSGEPVKIDPADDDIVWNSTLERWEVTFMTSGLGGFFVRGLVFGNPQNVSVDNTTVCSGNAVSLSATCEVGTVVWYNQASGGSALGTGSPLVQNPIANVTYYAACETEELKSGRVATEAITVNSLPDGPIEIHVSNLSPSIGQEVTLTASCLAGTIYWYGQASGAPPLLSGAALTVNPTANKIYYAACRDNGCESQKVAMQEIVPVLPVPADLIQSETAIIKGGAVTLLANCGISTVIWYTTALGGTSIGSGSPLIYYPSSNTTFYAACKYGDEESIRQGMTPVTVTAMEQLPYMMKDINVFQVGADIKNFVMLNGNAYFSATNAENGTELWKSDGTSEGTILLKDVNPGEASSSPANLTLVGDVIYFTARDEEYGIELWKTDGTNANTVRVKDINPYGDSQPVNLINLNGTLIFSAYTDNEGREIWKSNGTEGGTSLIADINEGGDSDPKEMTLAGNYVFFSAENNDYGRELWRTNGISADRITDIVVGEGSSNPKNMVVMDGFVYFQANNGVSGTELWKINVNPTGPHLVIDINEGEGGSDPANLTVMNGVLYFTANDGINGTELWKSDGNGEGTGMIRNINDGPAGSSPSGLVVFKDALYFQADNGTNGAELWKSTGDEAGTDIVIDIYTGASGSMPGNLVPAGDVMYFTASNATDGNELWKTNGNANGTELVKDINTGTGNSSVSNIIVNGNTIYFSADDGKHGAELWKSDGTTGGTALVKDLINRNGNALPSLFLNVAGTMYFLANDGTYGTELWKTDGTAEGTYLVRDLNEGSASTNIGWAIDFNGTMYFTTDDGVHGEELWKTNGQHYNTQLVMDINTASNTGSQIRNLVKANNKIFFAANDGVNGQELWVSDGTTDGTTMLKDIREGANGAEIDNLTVIGNNVYFSANDGIHGVELWKSDGTFSGTQMVKDIVEGAGGAGFESFTNVNGTLFLAVETSESGRELWKSDGTPGGTELVKDIRLGQDGSGLRDLTAVGNTVYFAANDGTHSVELWKSDGTPGGTLMVKDIYLGEESSSISRLTELNGELYFIANDGTHGAELWKTDGTTEHTAMLKDIRSGESGAAIASLVNVGGMLYFNANDGENGNELWRSNGTPEGTVMVKNASDGASSSGPYRLTNVNGKLYYYADPIINGVSYGMELWSLGTCTESNRIVENLELNRYFNKQVQVDPVTATCHCDRFNDLISTTNAVGEAPVSGETDARVWIDNEANAQYVKRHYEINPEENAATATGEVTLYFTQEDFQRYSELNNSAIFKLPYSHCEPEDIKYLRIERREGVSSDNSGKPESYTGEVEMIKPNVADINWNGVLHFWEVKFATKGFGGFFIKAATLTDPDSVSVNTTSICNGSSVTLSAYCDAGDLIWYNQASGGSSIGTGTNLSQSPTVNTTYYAACVYEANSSGRVATDEVIVTAVPGIPTGITAAKTTICSGESVTLSASCSTATVIWYGQSSGGSSIGSGTSISVSPGTPSAVYYASCSNGTCISARVATETITVNATPANPTSVSVDKTAICSGTSVSLSATCATGTITWYNQASGGSVIGTGTGLSQSPTNSTYYYATCKSGNCETERTSTDAITVTTQPTSPTSVQASSNAICSGTSVTMSASCSTGSVIWYNQSTGGSSIGSGTSMSLSPLSNTTFYASCKNGNCESSRVSTGTIVVTLQLNSPTSVSVNRTAICSGTSVSLTATCGTGTINWYNTASGGTAIGTGTGLSQSPSITTTYYASCKNGICESSRVVTSQVVVTAQPTDPTGISVNNTVICAGTTVSLNATCATGTITWYNQSTGGSAIGTGTGLSQSPTDNITYYAACVNGSCISERVATDAITIKPVPVKPVISGLTEICAGEPMVLTVSSNNTSISGSIMYNWSGGSSGASISISPTTVNMLRVAAVYDGCVSDSSDVFIVTPYEKPTAPTIVADNLTMCNGEVVVLTAECPSMVDAFYWVATNARPNVPFNPLYRNTRNISSPGTYKGYCLSANGCKSAETSITITQDTDCGAQSFISVTPDKPVICPGSSVTLTASGCTGTITWTGGPSVTTGTSANFSPGTTTTYIVQCSTGGNATVIVSVAPATATVTKNISTGTSQVKAVNTIEADKKVGDPNYTPSPKVSYEAGKAIILKPGFVAEAGSVFKAEIKTCN